MTNTTTGLVENAKQEFTTRGYAVVRALLSNEEVVELQEHFAWIHETGADGHYEHANIEETGDDPLLAYPRVMNPHRFSPLARRQATNPVAASVLRALFDEEPLAVQSMFYFKPPGSRGQAMHQDQFYLQVRPGTCIASWTALDHCDRANGGMVMVPLTQEMAIDCRKVGKPGAGSYGPNAVPVPVPNGYRGECPELDPGDTISEHYHPLVTMDGEDVVRGKTTDGGPCGGWVGAAH